MLAATVSALLRWPWSLGWLLLAVIVLVVVAALDDRRRNRRAVLEQAEKDAQKRYRDVLRRLEGHR